MKHFDRVVRISDVLSEACGDKASQLDLLALADFVVKADLNGTPDEYDRPLNVSASNFYSMSVDTALLQSGFLLASREVADFNESSEMGSFCPKKRYDEFCKLVA